MAYSPTTNGRKVLQNYRTKLTPDSEFESQLGSLLAEGEIFVKMGAGSTEKAKKVDSSLWILASDGVTPVKFVSEERVKELVQTGASDAVDNIISGVGLDTGSNAGKYIAKSGTNFLNNATTVEGEISALDTALGSFSGAMEQNIADMSASTVADDNKVITDVTQSNGQITATASNITGVKLTGYTEGSDAKVADTDTLGQALGKLQGQINAMDLSEVGGSDGDVLTAVSEADGKVSATASALKDVKLTGYVKDTGATGDIAATDDLEDALSKIENGIAAAKASTTLSAGDNSMDVTTAATGTTVALNVKSGEKVIAVGQDGVYTDIKITALTSDEITALSDENVKEAYKLQDTTGGTLGDIIKIYKDSSLNSVTLSGDSTTGSQWMIYNYTLADGSTANTAVDVSRFLVEAEFKSGVTADANGVVHGVVDASSESFLTVGENGFKLAGVQSAIDTAVQNASGSIIESLDAEVTGASSDGRVTVVIAETDGKLSGATVTLSDLASASALTEEIARAKSAETALDGVVGSTKGASDETRTYTHSNSNYLTAATPTVKTDVEALDTVLGKAAESTQGAGDAVEFSSSNTVASNIQSLKARIAAAEAKSVSAAGDNTYITATTATTANGVEVQVSAITVNIADATSASTGLVDAWDVKEYAVYNYVDTTSNNANLINLSTTTDSNGRKVIDFKNMIVDCGEFTATQSGS